MMRDVVENEVVLLSARTGRAGLTRLFKRPGELRFGLDITVDADTDG